MWGLWLTARSPHPYICLTPHWGGHVNTLYLLWRRSIGTKLGKMLSYGERLPPLSHLTLWSCNQREVTNIFISTFKRLMAAKHGKVLTYERKISIPTLKSSPTSCFICSWRIPGNTHISALFWYIHKLIWWHLQIARQNQSFELF